VSTLKVLVAGGGVAGLEACLALRDLAGDRVECTLLSPDDDFVYRPMAVAEPFARGRVQREPLARIAEDAGARLVRGALAEVDDRAREVVTAAGDRVPYDALVVAVGAGSEPAFPRVPTWTPESDPEVFGGLLRDIEEGYAKRVAFVVPVGVAWPLPAYELALMTIGEAREMGQHDVEVIVVTPEHAPLSLFGEVASGAVADELRQAGVQLRTGVVARREGGELLLEPGGGRLDVQRVYAVPRIVGAGIEGVATDEDGFIRAADDGSTRGCEDRRKGRLRIRREPARRGRRRAAARRPWRLPGSAPLASPDPHACVSVVAWRPSKMRGSDLLSTPTRAPSRGG
jgi:sulfide:quinone oxidoreductase